MTKVLLTTVESRQRRELGFAKADEGIFYSYIITTKEKAAKKALVVGTPLIIPTTPFQKERRSLLVLNGGERVPN